MTHVVSQTFGQGVNFYEGPTNQGSHGDWGACGPFALGNAMAAAKGIPFTGEWLDVIIARMQSGGHFSPTGGCAPSDLIWYLKTYATDMKFSVAPGIDFSGSDASANAFHNAVIPALNAGKLCVAEWLNAQALTQNEQGVHVHYTAIGGIDSTLGYLHINGDKVPDNIPNAPYWIGWQSMWNARPCSLIIIEKEGASPLTVPTGWKDDGKTLTAFNNIPVTLGFRDFILNTPTWSPDDVPVAPSFSRNPVTLAGNDGSGEVQYFYKSILAWTQNRGVFLVIDPGKEAYLGATRVLPTPPPPAPPPPPPIIDISSQVGTLTSVVTELSNAQNSMNVAINALRNTPGVKTQ